MSQLRATTPAEITALLRLIAATTDRPILVDICCCQGGAARGYDEAGFTVIGVDIDPQPRYPYPMIQADAIWFLTEYADWLRSNAAALHASWPCQAYSPLTALPSTKAASEHPDLVGPGRELMAAIGLPYVIENVMSAPLDKARSIVLCGEMFGLRTIRHRRFEAGGGLTLTAPRHPKRHEMVGGVRCDSLGHRRPTATKRRKALWGQGWHVSVTGDVGTYVGPEAMGIDWMDGNGLSEAIPVAYTRHVGTQLMAHLAAAPVLVGHCGQHQGQP